MLSLIVRTGRALSGGTSHPLSVALRRSEPAPSDAWARVFRAPVTFGADTNCMIYSSAVLDAQLPSGNPELAHYNDELVARHLARLDKDRFATRVHTLLAGLLASGEPSPRDVARELGLSIRSLQRHLADEGTSFKDVLAETRRGLAQTYLSDGHSSVTEVAFLLGFADTSSFARAFRRWTGSSPSEYRKHA
jgi:AraC-like DNA-binding protein